LAHLAKRTLVQKREKRGEWTNSRTQQTTRHKPLPSPTPQAGSGRKPAGST
uniref:Uncharacterized protein n=1 Tax=Aegilops tauschii subsp. strangulata TaxID=200361 RepID=A0A453J2R8_AEGTS